MTGENTHVAFDADLCRANPEAAADKIAELEYALQCAGGLDRTRVIVIEDLRKRLAEAAHRPLFRKALYDIIELDHHNMGPEGIATKIARKALNEEREHDD